MLRAILPDACKASSGGYHVVVTQFLYANLCGNAEVGRWKVLSLADTVKCPNCGLDNDVSFSLCQQCLTPLTAYSGQLNGEAYQGKLATQVKALNVRPQAVTVAAVFDVLFAVFTPIVIFIHSLPHQVTSDPDLAYQNTLSTAFGAVSAVITGIITFPIAIAICIHAWYLYRQRTWCWSVQLALIAVFAIRSCLIFKAPDTFSHLLAAGYLVFCAVFVALWTRPQVKAWYGQ